MPDNYDLLLEKIEHLKEGQDDLKEGQDDLKKSVSRIFGKLDENYERYENLDKRFLLCSQNGDNETKSVNREIELLKRTDVENFQELSVRISKADPETVEKKKAEETGRKKQRFDFIYGIIRAGSWVIITVAIVSASVALILHKAGIVDLNERGRPVITLPANTNSGATHE